jgi:tetratricopeptide (TPR) repeat protein
VGRVRVLLLLLLTSVGSTSVFGEDAVAPPVQAPSESSGGTPTRDDENSARRVVDAAVAAARQAGDPARLRAEMRNRLAVLMALRHFEDGVTCARELGPLLRRVGETSALASVLHDEGGALIELGRHHEAHGPLSEALKLYDGLGDLHGQGRIHATLADLHVRRGEHAEALRHAEKAEGALRTGGDIESLAAALRLLGSTYAGVGLTNDASAVLDRALGLPGMSRADRAQTLGTRGQMRLFAGDRAGAIVDFEAALAEFEADGNAAGRATALLNLAAALEQEGRLSAALALCRAADPLAHGHSYLAPYVHEQTAAILISMGRPGATRVHLEQALAAVAGQADLALEIDVRTRLGEALENLGRADLAQAEARSGLDALTRANAGLSDEGASTSRQARARLFRLAVRTARRSGRPEALVEMLEASRAVALAETMGGRAALDSSAVDVELDLRVTLVSMELDAAVATAERARADVRFDRVRIQKAREEVDRLTSERDRLADRQERERRARARLLAPPLADLAAMQDLLAPGDVLVLYSTLLRQAFAVVVVKDGPPRTVDLGPSVALERIVTRVPLDRHEREEAVRWLADLTARLVVPLALTADTRRVLVSADGALAYAPFPQLVARGGPPQATATLIPSATTYAALRNLPRPKSSRRLLVGVSDYDFPMDPAAKLLYVPGGRLSDLGSVPRELKDIRRPRDVLLLDEQAAEGAVRRAIEDPEGWQAVHLACHGLLNDLYPVRTALALRPGDGGDGFLTVRELMDLRMTCGLVVLSACQSGIGRVHTAEGVWGMTRALMIAGAPRILCSLWKVDDQATGALMRAFYRHWSPDDGTEAMTAAAALVAAQAEVAAQKKWAHPYYWAGWVLWGLPD